MEKIKEKDFKDNAESVLKNNISECLSNLESSEEEYETIYQQFKSCGFLSITAPYRGPLLVAFVKLDSLKNYSRGRSVKPGNIRLNIKALMDTIPDMIIMSVSIAVDIPVLQVCAALNLWKTIRGVFTVDISKDQAYLIVSLWKNCDSRHRISSETGFTAVNSLLGKYGEDAINDKKYNYLLDSLERIQCIELEDGVIRLRERVSKNYIDSI